MVIISQLPNLWAHYFNWPLINPYKTAQENGEEMKDYLNLK